MNTIVKRIDTDLVFDRMVGKHLELFLYLNNEENYEVPKDWHTSSEFMELELHFSINDIFLSFCDGYSAIKPDGSKVILNEHKKHFDALKKQLVDALNNIEALEYMSAKKLKNLYKEKNNG